MPLVPTLERIGGLQTQYAPSGYIGLWSRMRNFRREALTTALEQRRVIQGTLLRSTIHMVSARDYWLCLAAIKESRKAWWRRTRKELAHVDIERVAASVREQLRNQPRRATDLKAMLAASDWPPAIWGGVSEWLDMVRVPPSGTWEQRRADLYASADSWVRPATHTEAAGLEHLVRRYLGAFGPASIRDVAGWAGIPPTKFRAVMEQIPLRHFRDENSKELFDLPRAPRPDPTTPAPVRFLPTWDATLLVHARRTQILPEHYRPLVFNTKTPHSVPTFLVDGAVAGTWRFERGRVEIKPFAALPAAARADVDEEAKSLADFLSA